MLVIFLIKTVLAMNCLNLSGTYVMPGGKAQCKNMGSSTWSEFVSPTLPALQASRSSVSRSLIVQELGYSDGYTGGGARPQTDGDIVLEIDQKDCSSATINTRSYKRGSDPFGVKAAKNDLKILLSLRAGRSGKRKVRFNKNELLIIDPVQSTSCDGSTDGSPSEGECPRENFWSFSKDLSGNLMMNLAGPKNYNYNCEFIVTNNLYQGHMFSVNDDIIPRILKHDRPMGYPFWASAWLSGPFFYPTTFEVPLYINDDAFNLVLSSPARVDHSIWLTHWRSVFPKLLVIENEKGEEVFQKIITSDDQGKSNEPLINEIDLSDEIRNGILKPNKTYAARIFKSTKQIRKTSPVNLPSKFKLSFELPYPNSLVPMRIIAKAALIYLKENKSLPDVKTLLPDTFLKTVNKHTFKTLISNDAEYFAILAIPTDITTKDPRKAILLVETKTMKNQFCRANGITSGDLIKLDINSQDSKKLKCPENFLNDVDEFNPVPNARLAFRVDKEGLEMSTRYFPIQLSQFGNVEIELDPNSFKENRLPNGLFRFAVSLTKDSDYYAESFEIDNLKIEQKSYFSLQYMDNGELGYARGFIIQ